MKCQRYGGWVSLVGFGWFLLILVWFGVGHVKLSPNEMSGVWWVGEFSAEFVTPPICPQTFVLVM